MMKDVMATPATTTTETTTSQDREWLATQFDREALYVTLIRYLPYKLTLALTICALLLQGGVVLSGG